MGYPPGAPGSFFVSAEEPRGQAEDGIECGKVASNSRPSLLGLVQLANACANLFPRFWGIRIFLSKLIRILSKKGRSVW